MTEAATVEDPTATLSTETPKPAKPTDVKPEKDETDWKAEARKWESRAKENSTAAAKLAEIEEAKKTNEQKLEERAAAAEKLAESRALDAERALVALDKGLTASQAKRLVGTNRDELEADADLLIADLGPKPTGRVLSDPSQGPRASTSSTDPAQIFAQFLTQKRQ